MKRGLIIFPSPVCGQAAVLQPNLEPSFWLEVKLAIFSPLGIFSALNGSVLL